MDYGAIDLHARYSWVRLVTADGQGVLEQRVTTTREALRGVFEGRPALRVLVENSTESEWVAQTLEGCGHEVIVASPKYPLDVRPSRPADQNRSAGSAGARGGLPPGDLSPRAPRGRRATAAAARAPGARAVGADTDPVDQSAARPAAAGRVSIAQRGEPHRPAALCDGLGTTACGARCPPVLTLLETIGAHVRACDAQLKEAAAADGVVQRLMTAPGVGRSPR